MMMSLDLESVINGICRVVLYLYIFVLKTMFSIFLQMISCTFYFLLVISFILFIILQTKCRAGIDSEIITGRGS
jgi:hypothetical protein